MRIFCSIILYLSIFFSAFANERVWTNNSGDTFNATFVKLNDRDVVFDNKERGRIIIKLKDIGYQDIDYIKEIEGQKRKKNGILEPAFKWYTDIEEAKRASKRQGLPILIYHRLPGCPFCTSLEKNILHTKEYEEYSKNKIISLELNIKSKSSKTNHEFRIKNYGFGNIPKGFPRVCIANRDGIPVYEKEGFSPSEMPSPREYLDGFLKHWNEDSYGVLMACKVSDGKKSGKTIDYKKVSQIVLENNPDVFFLDNVFIGKEKNETDPDKISFFTGMKFFHYDGDKEKQEPIMGVLAKEKPITIKRTDFSKKYKGCSVTVFEFDQFIVMGTRFAKGTKEKGYIEIAERIVEMSKKYNKKMVLVSGDFTGWKYDAAIGGTFANQTFSTGKIDKKIEYPGIRMWVEKGKRLYVDHINMEKTTYGNAMRLFFR